MALEPELQWMCEGIKVQFYQFVVQAVDCEIKLTGYRGSKYQTIQKYPGHNLLLKKKISLWLSNICNAVSQLHSADSEASC